MTNNWQYLKEHGVYPGGYIPMPDTEALLDKNTTDLTAVTSLPAVNLNELDNYFTLEILIPGVNREEMLVSIHENILSVQVLHKNLDILHIKTSQIHEFDNCYFERRILLPSNVEAALISAAYHQGILNLHIPKTNHPSQTGDNIIVVY